MGFLSGVLSNIQKHLGQHNEQINDAITSLETNKHGGKKGFNAAIGKVVEGVRGYNEKVRESNESVKNPIQKMIEYTKKDNGELRNELDEIKENFSIGNPKTNDSLTSVDNLADKSIQNAAMYIEHMNKSENDINDLHNDLKVKVKNVNKAVDHECDRLRRSAITAKDNMIAITDKINTTMAKLKKRIDAQVTEGVKELVMMLKNSIQNVVLQLVKISDMLNGHIRELAKWMNDTNRFIDGGQTEIAKIIDKQVGKNEQDAIKAAAEQIKSNSLAFHGVATAAKEQVNALVSEAHTTVTQMNDALRVNLHQLKNKIKTAIWDNVNIAIVPTFRALRKGVQKKGDDGVDNIDSIEHNLEELKKRIKDYVGRIKGEGRGGLLPYKDGLNDIVKGVVAYAQKFGEGQFVSVITQWITSIVKTDKIVDGYITWYAGANKGHGKLGSKSADAVKQTINEYLPTFIESLIQEVAAEVGFDDDVKVSNIASKFQRFADLVAAELTDSNLVQTVNEETVKVEALLEVPADASDNTFLKSALKAIFSSIVVSVKNCAAEILRFVKETHIENVDTAITNADLIANEVDNNKKKEYETGYGHKIDTALEGVKRAIEPLDTAFTQKSFESEVHKKLNEQIGDDAISVPGSVADKVIINTSNFTEYENYINQPVVSGLPSDNLKGYLPTAITKIKNQVSESLRPIDTLREALEQRANEVENKLAELTAFMSTFAKDHIKWYFDLLKDDKIGNTVNSIRAKLQTLQRETLEVVIRNLTTFVEVDADILCTNTIEQIKYFIDNKLNAATSTLTTAARRNYVTSVKQLLAAFADKVEKELRDLPGEIDEDLRIGFKGFMKTLEDGTTKHLVQRGKNIEELKKLATQFGSSGYTPENFKNLSDKFKHFWTPLASYVNKQIIKVYDDEKNKNPAGTPAHNYSQNLLTIYDTFNELLIHIKSANRYDHILPKLLDKVDSALSSLKPDGFAKASSPVIDGLLAGLAGFGSELRKVYISAYDKETFRGVLVNSADTDKAELTKEGRDCAKVFLTILEILTHDVGKLTAKCDTQGGCKDKQINLQVSNNLMNPLGVFMRGCGFVVSKLADSHEGELRNEAGFTGAQIQSTLLNSALREAEKIEALRTWKEEKNRKIAASASQQGTVNIILLDVIHFLFGKLESYWRVCHYYIPPHPKMPSNVYQMLQWLDGLWLNPALTSVYKSIKDLFKKPEKAEDIKNALKYKLAAYPSEITYAGLAALLQSVCFFSHDTLIVILGLGDADGRYAVEFRSNPDGLSYPSNAGACFDMFTDILHRVYHQLRFLYRQCQNGTGRSGWEDCYYGKGVGGSAWNCNTMQCAKQIRGQTCPQMVNQMADQTCDQHPNCGLKSPLQSFLEDGLQGFLPHQIEKPGCKLTCTVAKHRGIPCKTPMGFSDLGITASRAEKGSELWKLLYQFCGLNDKPLSTLCAQLNCLLRQPPQTLGDMFSFFQGYLSNWNGGGRKHKKEAFENAVKRANFNNAETKLDVTSIQQSSKHDSHTAGEKKQINGDIFSLVECKSQTSMPNVPCGAYLQSISYDVRMVYSKEHASHYLSWVVYISETFWDLLKQLYEQCCRNCNKAGSRCHDRSCVNDCQVNKYYGSPKSEFINNIKHENECNSIVTCRNTHAAIYAAGFTFGSPHELSGAKDKKTKRTCQDLCKALENVCADSSVLARLVHDYIPKFLWEIREKFFWLTVALWSLSLFYLVCVMVGRLDVLHIRSHLRIPSSHKITAQSLLAAAQVGRLAKISYLQP